MPDKKKKIKGEPKDIRNPEFGISNGEIVPRDPREDLPIEGEDTDPEPENPEQQAWNRR